MELCGVKLPNPTVLCSGYLGVSAGSLAMCARAGAGAVTSKSCSLEAKKGHELPAVIHWNNIVMNAVGLSNPGVEETVAELKEYKRMSRVPLIASVFADSPENFAKVAAGISEARPDFIELNLSCPHAAKGDILFADSPEAAAEVIARVKEAVKAPVFAKLSPNVRNIAAIAKACAEAGADGITAVNTLGPGMKIDIHARKPVLGNKFGGVSGPGLKPIAVKCVYDIARAVDVPIIGMGGILTGEDAVEFLMAGASAVGIGSALIWHGLGAFKAVSDGIDRFMQENGYSKIEELRLEE
ncbi:MAG: dihydroorotate dehydrogenase [Candidatus Micrarchaeia archaeon]